MLVWAILFLLSSLSSVLGLVLAAYPPSDITIIQSPDASDSNAPVTIGTPITYTITARDPDVPPAASLTFTIHWDFFNADFSPGNRSLNDSVTAATNASGHATATVTHTYVDIGPHQQKDNNNDGTMDVGGWFVWVEVDDGVDGLGISAAYSFMTLALGNQPPVITLGLPSIRNTVVNPPNHNYTVTLSFTVQDPEGDHLNVTWDYGDGSLETVYLGPVAQEATVTTTHLYDANVTLTPAYYNWTLRATVDDGHDHPVVVGPTLISMYVTLDSGPVFEGDITFTPTFGDPPYTYNGIALNFTVTARDSNGDPLYYSWDFNNDTAIDALGSRVSWILLDKGVHMPHPIYGDLNWSLHEVRAFATDGYWKLPADAHNQSRSLGVWTRDNARVLLTPLPTFNDTFNATLEQPLTFTWQVFDPDGDPVSFAVDYGDGSQVEIILGMRNDSYDTPGFYNLTFNHTYTFATCEERENRTRLVGTVVVVEASYCVYRLTVAVSDGHTEAQQVQALVHAGSMNRPPTASALWAQQDNRTGEPFLTRLPVNFTLMNVSDSEGDTIRVDISYGDSSYETLSLDGAIPQSVFFQHVYYTPGIYRVTVAMTDHQVGIFDHNPHLSLSVYLEDAVPPPDVQVNDVFDYAIVVASLPFFYAEDTRQATVAPDDPYCFGRSATVWFSYRATEASVIEADTFGSNYDTTLSAYTGTRGNLSQVACSDDYSGPQSFISFYAMAGTTYHFMASAYGMGTGGDLVINIRSQALPPPPEVRFTLGEPSAVQQSFLAPNLVVIIPLRIEVMGSLVFPLYYDVRVYIDGNLDHTEPGTIFPGDNMIVDRPILLLLGRAAEVAVEVAWNEQVVATGGPWTVPGYTATLRLQRGMVELGDGAVISLELRADLHILLAARFDFTVIIDGRPSVESHFVTTSNQSRLQGSLCPPFLPCAGAGAANATLYRYSWDIPLSRGQHTVRIEIRDVGLDHLVATAEFGVEVRNQFGRRTLELQEELADARQDLEALETGFHPLGLDVGPLVERLRRIKTSSEEMLREVQALGPLASDVALEVKSISLEADSLTARAVTLSSQRGYTAGALWSSLLGLVVVGAGLGIAVRRKRRKAEP